MWWWRGVVGVGGVGDGVVRGRAATSTTTTTTKKRKKQAAADRASATTAKDQHNNNSAWLVCWIRGEWAVGTA